jgi:hypothetical protein
VDVLIYDEDVALVGGLKLTGTGAVSSKQRL